MKKLLLPLSCIIAISVSAQQKNSLKVNPVSILVGGGSDLVSYERAMSEHSSLGISAGYGEFKIDSYKYNYFGGNTFYRYYTKEVLHGLYFSGMIGIGGGKTKYRNENKNMKDTYSALELGGLIGYQWLFDSGFTIDISGGASYMFFNYKEDHKMLKPNDAKVSGFLPSLGLGIGYSF